MFSHRGEANRYIEIYPAIIVLKCGLYALFILPTSKHFISFLFALLKIFFTLTSNKFRMVYKVDGNPQLDSRDWRMYSNILKTYLFGRRTLRYIQERNQFPENICKCVLQKSLGITQTHNEALIKTKPKYHWRSPSDQGSL